MIQRKRGFARPVLVERAKRPVRYCQNPGCRAKITNPDNEKYCDRICANEHQQLLKLERRPKDLFCEECEKPLDPLSREPSTWQRAQHHFCDEICATTWAAKQGKYQEMNQRATTVIRTYKQKHGHRHNHMERAQKTREMNQTHPPKSKIYTRSGNVWGYEAHVLPNETKTGYIAHIPELIGQVTPVEASTKREALSLLRKQFSDIRAQERRKEALYVQKEQKQEEN